jgi:NAD(P)-dependent dehydrogenase (short-subunit alcohol dehydrogenase family)
VTKNHDDPARKARAGDGRERGIGAAIAKKLAADGADVAITYEKSADRAAEVVREIQALGCRGVAIQAESADVAAVQASDGPYSLGQVQLTASGRYGKPEEIAHAVVFLSSSAAQYITGIALTVDGQRLAPKRAACTGSRDACVRASDPIANQQPAIFRR